MDIIETPKYIKSIEDEVLSQITVEFQKKRD
jgi:hypothetical protein